MSDYTKVTGQRGKLLEMHRMEQTEVGLEDKQQTTVKIYIYKGDKSK